MTTLKNYAIVISTAVAAFFLTLFVFFSTVVSNTCSVCLAVASGVVGRRGLGGFVLGLAFVALAYYFTAFSSFILGLIVAYSFLEVFVRGFFALIAAVATSALQECFERAEEDHTV